MERKECKKERTGEEEGVDKNIGEREKRGHGGMAEMEKLTGKEVKRERRNEEKWQGREN